MSVQDIIARLEELDPAERRQLRAALSAIPTDHPLRSADEPTPEERQRGLEAMEQLLHGVCSGGGRHLSVGIDAAIYRAER